MSISSRRNPLGFFIVAFIAGIALFFMNVGDVTRLQSPATDFNLLKKDDFIDGDIVEGNAIYTLGCIAEEYTERNGVRYGTGNSSQYYVIPAGEAEFVVLQVGEELYTSMDILYNQTVEYIENDTSPGTSVFFKGKIEKTGDQVSGWFYDYMKYFYGTENAAEVEPLIINYTINCKNWDEVYTMFYIGLGLMIFGAAAIIIYFLVLRSKTNTSTYISYDNPLDRSQTNQNFNWDASIPAPTSKPREDAAQPPSADSEIMDSVAPPENGSISSQKMVYGGYSSNVNIVPDSESKLSNTDIESSLSINMSNEAQDAFSDLQNNAMKSFSELSSDSKNSFESKINCSDDKTN